MSAEFVKAFNTDGFGTGHLRVGDLNGDGIPEFLLTQCYPMNREISAITAMDQEGNILWQIGEPGVGGSWSYADIPVQIIDWDGDGKNEVLYIRQAIYKNALVWQYSAGRHVEMYGLSKEEIRLNSDLATERAMEYEGSAWLVVLDGATGEVKKEIELPASADDCIAFGWFDDSGLPGVFVKDRYWNGWCMNNAGEILWHIEEKDMPKANLGHMPGIGDIDGDGYDEVFMTDRLIDHDGTLLWTVPDVLGHSDTAVIVDDIPQRCIITSADKARLITPEGKVLWAHDVGHGQYAQVGRFSDNPAHGPRQFFSIDLRPDAADYVEGCSMPARGEKLTMYDWNGKVLWTKEWPKISGGFRIIRWTGGTDCIAHFTTVPDESGLCPCQIINGAGEIIENIYLRKPDGSLDTETDTNAEFVPVLMTAADLRGDSRDELVLYNGQIINIFANTAPYNQRRHYNFTHYNGE